MNLISCQSCGVVLNKDYVGFPKNTYKEVDYCEVDMEKASWDGEDYVAKISCPVCKEDILETDT